MPVLKVWIGLATAWIGMVTAVEHLIFGQSVPEPYGVIAQYGLAGILGVLLIKRYDNELQRERAARERADQQRDALTEKIVSDIVPLVAEVQRTMVPSLDRLATEVQRMRERIDRVEQSQAGG